MSDKLRKRQCNAQLLWHWSDENITKNERFQSDLTSTLSESCVPDEVSVISGYLILVKVIRETAHLPLWISLWVSPSKKSWQ